MKSDPFGGKNLSIVHVSHEFSGGDIEPSIRWVARLASLLVEGSVAKWRVTSTCKPHERGLGPLGFRV